MNRGIFIVLEGIDGAGTTTQVDRLVATLRKNSCKVHRTREPSDGPFGTLIRQILGGRIVARTPDGPEPLWPETVALLFAADRMDHVQSEILPSLERGIHVVTDRYVHSSLAYQSVRCPLEWVSEINKHAPIPDLTVFLEVPPSVALNRIASRLTKDIYEEESFQKLVDAKYREVIQKLKAEKHHIVELDGQESPDAIADQIYREVSALLSRFNAPKAE
jgi:dTMP kinase